MIPEIMKSRSGEELAALVLKLAGLTGIVALVCVLLTADGRPARRSTSGRPAARPREVAFSIPVASIAPADLVDSFHEPRDGKRTHRAIDIPAPAGSPVLAAVDGRIAGLARSPRGGLGLYQIDAEETVCLFYAHLERYAPGLREGASIRQGEILGFVGSTGNASPDAPHLHFQILALAGSGACAHDRPINPFLLLVDKRRSDP